MVRLTLLALLLLPSALACSGGDQADSDAALADASARNERTVVIDKAIPKVAPTPPGEAASVAETQADTDDWNRLDGTAAPSETAPVATGPDAPAFKVTTLDGRVLDSSVLYGTKPVSITLWATWCGPCIMEAPVLQELYEQYGDQVEFIAISIDDPNKTAAIEKFIADKKVTYPIAHDSTGVSARSFDARSIPLTVLVDKNGKVADRLEGFGGPARMKEEFRAAFGAASGAGTAAEANERV